MISVLEKGIMSISHPHHTPLKRKKKGKEISCEWLSISTDLYLLDDNL